MLEPNRLNPPRPYDTTRDPVCSEAADRDGRLFVSPDDFDGTGIMAGFDPCSSSYWWMPELHASEPAELTLTTVATGTIHATRRTASRPQAAA